MAHQKSPECTLAELDLFSAPVTQLSIKDKLYTEILPVATPQPCREPTPSTPSHASQSKPSLSPPIPGSAVRITSFWDPCWAWCITKPSQEKNLSPFNFIHNDVEYLSLCQDGRHVPAKAFQPQYGQGILVREFYNMFIATGRHLKDLPLSINRKEFNEGHSLFVFNLEPCEDSDSVPRLHRKFKTGNESQTAPPPHHHTRGVRLLLFDSQCELKEGKCWWITTD
ncbi:hypothetical protein L3Q82_017703 [Scortum barcoo]|uniref:Uncharacterized protein n=1 Tax=Scortum barcoo TaxID=214431 RepID=A0ACB8VPS8_9TELE|nr:hypothetical protein L3Q82_017703 [Scortum barcoo]